VLVCLDEAREEVGTVQHEAVHEQILGVGQKAKKEVGAQAVVPAVQQGLRGLTAVEVEESGLDHFDAREVELHDPLSGLDNVVLEEGVEVLAVLPEAL
jgi:hypothetical protein